MLRVYFLLVVAIMAVLAKKKDECFEILPPDALKCCDTKVVIDSDYNKVEGCEMTAPPNCDGEICAAKILGITTAGDGTFDKKAMEEYIRKMLQNSPESADYVVKTCVNGDFSSYGPSDYCDLINFKQCLVLNFLSRCSDWHENDACSELKMFVDECT